MTMHKQDPDVVRWGLHLLTGDPSLTSGCRGSTNQNDISIGDMEHSKDRSFAYPCTTVENDAVIAHALQEEFSNVAIAEASGSSHDVEDRLQASVLAQDWCGPSVRNLNPEEGVYEQGEDMGTSSSFPSPEERSYGEEECSLELCDESSLLDGEVGKRLTEIVPIPHVPRINREIPSVDEATSDYQRLLDRLRLYDLVERKVQGDGNCQFRALSDQFYRTPEHHKFVRQQVVNQLKAHSEIYEGYVPMDYGDYLKKMPKNGEWGDHVTLQAAADSYGVKIFIITSFKETCYIEILPNVQKSNRVIFLSFWAEVHYNSIYPEGEFPIPEGKKKKWWHL